MNAADDRSLLDQDNTGRHRPRPRVHWIHYPPVALRIRQITVLVVGAMITGIVGFALAFFALSLVFAALKSTQLYVVGTVATILSLVAPILLVRGWAREDRTRRLNQPPGRGDRLSRLVESDHGAQRFPHRAIELCVRRHRTDWMKRKSVMGRIPLGTVIVGNGPRLGEAPRPRGCDVPFEPIDLRDESQRLIWITNQDPAAPDQAAPADKGTDQNLRHHMHIAWRVAKAYAPTALPALYLACLVYDTVRNGITVMSTTLMVLFGLAVGGFLWAFLLEHRYWLVPGGLIHRETRVWSKQVKATLYSREDSALFIDLRGELIMVARDDTVLSFPCGPYSSWGVLSGWLSRARTPTMEEVLAFTGAEGTPGSLPF